MSDSTATTAYVEVLLTTGEKRRVSHDEFDRLCDELAAKMESGDGLAAAQLGTQFLQVKDHSRAEACFTKAAALGQSDAYLLLGFMFRDLGDKGQEKSAYETALSQGCALGAFFLGGLADTRKDSLTLFELYLELSQAECDIRSPEYRSRVNQIIDIHRLFPGDVARLQKKYLRMPFYQRWAYRVKHWRTLLFGLVSTCVERPGASH